MTSATSNLFKTLSIADSCGLSRPHLFTAKAPTAFLSIPAKPTTRLHLISKFAPSLSLKSRTQFSSIVSCVASESPVAIDGEEGVFAEVEEETVVDPPEEAKIFVGNLPFDVDSQTLAELFEKAGVVEIAEVIYNRDTDQSRGFGFVTMSTVEEAEKAVEMFSRFDLNGRLLTVNKSAPRGSRPERPPRSFGSSFRCYVGNLPWNVDNGQLEQLFSEHGQVEDARVVFDRETGRSRGFGFVTMASEADMNSAIEALDGQSLDGRPIRVNVAEQRPSRY